MGDQLEFKVSESLVRPIIEAKINAAVVEALGGHEKVVTDMLNVYMSQKVDSEGKTSGYRSNIPRIEHLMHKMIQGALVNALRAFLDTKMEMIQGEFEKYFKTKKGSSQIVKAMQEGLCESLSNQWRTTVTFRHKGES